MPKPPMPPMEDEEDDKVEGEPTGEPEAPMPPRGRMAPDGDPTAPEDEEEEPEEEEEDEDEDEDEDEGPYGRKGLDFDPDDALATDTEILKSIVGIAVREAVAPIHAKMKRLETLVKGLPLSVAEAAHETIAKSVAVVEPESAKPNDVQPASIGKTQIVAEKGVIAAPGEGHATNARALCAKALGLMRDKRASIPAYNEVEYALRMGTAIPDVTLKALVEQIDAATTE